jgi:hypothetical protein
MESIKIEQHTFSGLLWITAGYSRSDFYISDFGKECSRLWFGPIILANG